MAEVEIWKDIPRCQGYQVSNLGRVRSLDRLVIHKTKGKLLKPIPDHGYQMVTVFKKRGHSYVHKLVALAFLGDPPTGMEVCHRDGNRSNNVPDNLYYGTRADNVADMVKHKRAWWVSGLPNPVRYRWNRVKNSK